MYEEVKDENDPKEDYEFEEQSKLFLAGFQAMKEKYQHLLLKQSQVNVYIIGQLTFSKFIKSTKFLLIAICTNIRAYDA